MVLLLVMVLVVLVPTTYYSVFHGSPLRIDVVSVGHPSTLDHIIQHLRVEARFVVHTVGWRGGLGVIALGHAAAVHQVGQRFSIPKALFSAKISVVDGVHNGVGRGLVVGRGLGWRCWQRQETGWALGNPHRCRSWILGHAAPP